MKTVVTGSDDVINITLTSSLTKRVIPLTPYFIPGGDVICAFQNSDGITASKLSWSATGGDFPGTIMPVSPEAGEFNIIVPREASSGWMPADSCNIEVILQDQTGKRIKRNLTGIFALVPDDIVGIGT